MTHGYRLKKQEFPTYDIDERGWLIYNYCVDKQVTRIHTQRCTAECCKVFEDSIAYVMTLPKDRRKELPLGAIYMRSNWLVGLNRYIMGKEEGVERNAIHSQDWCLVLISERLLQYLGYECTYTI